MENEQTPLNTSQIDSLEGLSLFLEFLSCASEDQELCHPGLQESIRLASSAAKKLVKAEKDP